MAKGQKHSNMRKGLVLGYLERISSKAFSDFPKELTDLVSHRHGVYALYKGNKLYYVGLATDLKNRINNHLRDKHSGKWDKFSLYLIHKIDHIHELESLVLRISEPRGNRTHGKLRSAENLSRKLRATMAKAQKKQLESIMGFRGRPIEIIRPKSTLENDGNSKVPTLAPYITSPFKLMAVYKGVRYNARVRKNGKVYFKGAVYNSPSHAGRNATGRAINGWWFWKYKDKKGDWVRLRELRIKHR